MREGGAGRRPVSSPSSPGFVPWSCFPAILRRRFAVPHRVRPAVTLSALLSGLALSGCGLLFSEGSEEARTPAPPSQVEATPSVQADRPAPDSAADFPGGYGTLRQDEISMRLRRGELELLVTPLAESVTRTTAPDTWERLSALARTHRSSLRDRTGADAVQLFLVALHSEHQAVAFEPDDLTLVSRGLRFRPLEILGLTPGWDRLRVGPRETLLAIYAFPDQVDLEREVEVEYQEVRSREWEQVLPVVQAERGRARARAGGGPGAR